VLCLFSLVGAKLLTVFTVTNLKVLFVLTAQSQLLRNHGGTHQVKERLLAFSSAPFPACVGECKMN
jgi:hypothetical protein